MIDKSTVDPAFCRNECCAGRFFDTQGCMAMSEGCPNPDRVLIGEERHVKAEFGRRI